MPKPNQSMTAREREICERVRIVRKEVAKWSQPDMARELGITQNQLASIEYGRVPLRYWDGLRLCNKFDINQRWLAKGILPRQPSFDLKAIQLFDIQRHTLFSRVFDGYHDHATELLENAILAIVGEEDYRAGKFNDAIFADLPPADSSPAQAAAYFAKKALNIWFNWLPDDLLLLYANGLLDYVERFPKKYAKRLAGIKPPSEREKFKAAQPAKQKTQVKLDIENSGLHTSGVQSRRSQIKSLPQLMDAVREMVKERGQKTALARELGMSRQAVDQWLSGESKPSAELTFELLNRIK